MDSQLINKYEKLLLRLDARLEESDLTELSELISSMVTAERIIEGIAVLRLATFYQPEIPELWTQLGDLHALNSNMEESSNAHMEAARLCRNRLFEITAQEYIEVVPPQGSFLLGQVYA